MTDVPKNMHSKTGESHGCKMDCTKSRIIPTMYQKNIDTDTCELTLVSFRIVKMNDSK